MANEITLSLLRANIYEIFDEIINSGESLVLVHRGKRLRIKLEEKVGRLSRLNKRKVINGDASNIDKVSWSGMPCKDLS